MTAEEAERLRDHFAAHALTGLLAAHAVDLGHLPQVAHAAYDYADAMLSERKRRTSIERAANPTLREAAPNGTAFKQYATNGRASPRVPR